MKKKPIAEEKTSDEPIEAADTGGSDHWIGVGDWVDFRHFSSEESELARKQFVSEVKRYMPGVKIVDATGKPIKIGVTLTSDNPQLKGFINLTAEDFERLNTKTTEVLTQAALAYERIAKDQEQIEQLKTETRAMLVRLRAA